MTTTRRLGSTDLEITPIGLGCMQFAGGGIAARFYPELDPPVIDAVVRAALDGGISWFDTAEMYGGGHSERALTSALRGAGVGPGDVAIMTKWAPPLRRASHVRRSIDTRLGALQGFPIDLYQIHVPWGSLSPIGSQVRAMAELQRAGKVAGVGVSNFSARQMERADAILRSYGLRLVANQVQISLLHRAVEHDGVLETARRLGVTLIAHSPLRSGLLTGRFHDGTTGTGSLTLIRRTAAGFSARNLARTAPLIEELAAIAHAHGVTVAQVALSWLITYYGDTVVAIPGASRPAQARESSAAMDLRLTAAEIARVDELSAGLTRRSA